MSEHSESTEHQGLCFPEGKDTPSLFQNGKLVLQKYHIGFVVTGSFALIATVVSIWLVDKHLQWYHNKREQRYIVRILFMVPIYALVSFASFVFWNHSTALILIRDGYESTVLTSFFYLLLMYLDHDPDKQKSIFLKVGLSREADRDALRRRENPQAWVFPLGFIKRKPQDGLLFLQLMKWGVLQYCVLRPVTTFIAVMLNYFGLYCEESWSPVWGHIHILVVVSLSVTVAMYCLIQLYVPVAERLAPHKPLLKLFAIKAVVFLTFWQATFLGVLSMFKVVKETEYMTAADVNIGIGALLETVEMAIFAFLHIRAFTYKSYRDSAPLTELGEPERTPRLRSLGHAMDFRETFREIWIGMVYIVSKIRGREPSIDVKPRRVAHYEEAFGKSRVGGDRSESERVDPKKFEPEATLPAVEVGVQRDIMVDIEGERQWLGLGNNYVYGLGYVRREKSQTLGAQIGQELERRGYGWTYDALPVATKTQSPQNHGREPSWWRRLFQRGSDRGSEHEEDQNHVLLHESGRRSRAPSRRIQRRHEPTIDDPPPPSILRRYRGQPDGPSARAHGFVHVPVPSVAAGSPRRLRDEPTSRYPPSGRPSSNYATQHPETPPFPHPTSVSGLPGHHVMDNSVGGLTELANPLDEEGRHHYSGALRPGRSSHLHNSHDIAGSSYDFNVRQLPTNEPITPRRQSRARLQNEGRNYPRPPPNDQ